MGSERNDVNFLVYKWCWIISSDNNLVHEKAALSILDNNVDFESHAIIIDWEY